MGRSQNCKNGSTKNIGVRSNKPSIKMSPSSKPVAPGVSKGGSDSTGKAGSDRSQLNFPYDVRLSGYSSIHNAVTNGTPRIRRLLMEECDYIMECRVCRNLFRSLPNFITHKLSYCKKLFDSTWSIGLSNLIQTSDISYNIEYEVDPALLLDDNSSNNSSNTRSVADLYGEIASKARKCDSSGQSTAPFSSEESSVKLHLKPLMPGGAVVLQQIEKTDPSNCDISSPYRTPVQTVCKDTAVLGPDGKVMYTGTSKGIEHIVSRLTARLEAKQAQMTKSTSITCDICKTIFDSEKSLRQHKRESLDCGRTWGFKFPIGEKATAKDSCLPHRSQEETQNNPKPITSNLVRRQSLKATQSPGKPKRPIPMSPAKKIKLKYIKLDTNGTGGEVKAGKKSLSCLKCASSFSTTHEMTMHLAMCNGVINYAFLRDNDPPTEKIRIVARNDFIKSPATSAALANRWQNYFKPEIRTNTNNLSPASSKSPDKSIVSESTSEIPRSNSPIKNEKKPSTSTNESSVSTTCSESTSEKPTEVNNNRQSENEESQTKSTVNPNENGTTSRKRQASGQRQNAAAAIKLNGIISEDIKCNGDISESVIETDVTSLSTILKPKKSKILSDSPNLNSKKSKPLKTRINGTHVDQVSGLDRGTPKTSKSINLRRAVTSRIRKSKRTLTDRQPSSKIKLFKRESKKVTQTCRTVTTGAGRGAKKANLQK